MLLARIRTSSSSVVSSSMMAPRPRPEHLMKSAWSFGPIPPQYRSRRCRVSPRIPRALSMKVVAGIVRPGMVTGRLIWRGGPLRSRKNATAGKPTAPRRPHTGASPGGGRPRESGTRPVTGSPDDGKSLPSVIVCLGRRSARRSARRLPRTQDGGFVEQVRSALTHAPIRSPAFRPHPARRPWSGA